MFGKPQNHFQNHQPRMLYWPYGSTSSGISITKGSNVNRKEPQNMEVTYVCCLIKKVPIVKFI